MVPSHSVRFLWLSAILQLSKSTVNAFAFIKSPNVACNFSLEPKSGLRAIATPPLTRHYAQILQEDSIDGDVQSRRNFMDGLLVTSAAAAVAVLSNPAPSLAEEEEIEVYFGCGCFWHVQHEFVEAERRILKRSDSELTARTGYAGGTGGAKDGKVCYHNSKRVSDYGSLGHAEVVRLRIPPSSFPQFCEEYAKLFDKNGSRPDQDGDKGSEYRNLVGFPGGAADSSDASSKYVKQLIEASKATGDKLAFAKGNGDDPDRRALVSIMDTANYPFFVSEQYHQFHDGFLIGENYPDSYNKIADQLAKANTLGASGCPKGMN